MGPTDTGVTPLSVDRDLLELMVAYGFVPTAAIAGASPAAARSEAPAPRRTPGLRPLALAVAGAAPHAGRTTVIAGLARAWSRAGRSVLLIDLDPSDELARLLLLGSAYTVNSGQFLLRAVADTGPIDPSHTILPGVDVVCSGGLSTWDPLALPAQLRGRPEALRAALGGELARYDRILVDTPTAPHALWEAALDITDAVLLVLPAAALPPAGLRLEPYAKPRHILVSALDPAAPPDAAALGALADRLDTAIPLLTGLRSPWEVISGTFGLAADVAFASLAAELDAR